VYAHLLDRTEHSTDCTIVPDVGLACADDCRTRQFLAWLEEPLNDFDAKKDKAAIERKLNERWQVA
jgi:hypothetical protein